jgi:MoaA/NifB/PqqE/SkfB family radical SAM enzyme
MKKAMLHAARTYRWPSSISSNCYWAKTPEDAVATLKPFYDVGLRSLQVSVDDFHQEWVPLDCARHAIRAAIGMGIKCTVICVVTRNSRKLKDYVADLGVEESEMLRVAEAPCTPVGFATERIPPAEFAEESGVPSNYCSMLDVLNILPNGSVQLCCGAPFSMDALNAGNARRTPLTTIISEAEYNPVFNALALETGPRALAGALEEEGKSAFMKKGYCSSCDACQHILGEPGVLELLQRNLARRRAELFLARTIAVQMRGESNEQTVVETS